MFQRDYCGQVLPVTSHNDRPALGGDLSQDFGVPPAGPWFVHSPRLFEQGWTVHDSLPSMSGTCLRVPLWPRRFGSTPIRERSLVRFHSAANDTHNSSLSFRTYILRLANAGWHQSTSRPKALLVASSKWARE